MRTRTWLVLLFLCFVVYSQTASLVSEQSHQHSSHHCCALCHAGMPFVQAAPAATLTPVVASAWLEVAHGAEYPPEVLLFAESSRAPPA